MGLDITQLPILLAATSRDAQANVATVFVAPAMQRGKYTSDCSGEAFTLLPLLFLNNMLGYADRTNLSVAVIAMSRELGWGEARTGTLLASFFCGYVLTQIPAGLAAARFGAKRVLLIGTVVWSAATVLTPWAARQSIDAALAACTAPSASTSFAAPDGWRTVNLV